MEILRPEFVTKLPTDLDAGIIYISPKYKTIAHLCPCGCGEEVITPLSKHRGWVMKYDGQSISLSPSVGNWNINCQSHYWIKENRICWCKDDLKGYKKRKKPRKSFFAKMFSSILFR